MGIAGWTPGYGHTLREILRNARISNEQAAELAEVDRTTIYRWLSGRQSPLLPQSWKKGGLERLGRHLGFETLEAFVEALSLGSQDAESGAGSANPDPYGIGEAGRLAQQYVFLRGAASWENLSAALGDKAASGVDACLRESIVVGRYVAGQRYFLEPGLALAAAIAYRPVKLPLLAAELGLDVAGIGELLRRRAGDLEQDSDGAVRLAAHDYRVVVFDWSETLVDEANYDYEICESLAAICGHDAFRTLLNRLEADHDPRWWDYFFLASQFGISGSQVVDAHRRHRSMMAWIPGAEAVVAHAGEKSETVLATNWHSDNVRLRMELLGLAPETFSRVVTSDEFDSVRSKREMYAAILAEFDVAAEDVLVISNTYDQSVLPALTLGCQAVWFARPRSRFLWLRRAPRTGAGFFYLLRNSARSRLPGFVAFDHRETLSWLEGTPRARHGNATGVTADAQ